MKKVIPDSWVHIIISSLSLTNSFIELPGVGIPVQLVPSSSDI